MPVYDYLCKICGSFSALRPMADFQEPLDCPECGKSAPRAMLRAPAIAGMQAELRTAHTVNERASHAPKTLAEHTAGRHGAGCSCCSGSKSKGRAVQRGKDGSKSFPTSRPWMISH